MKTFAWKTSVLLASALALTACGGSSQDAFIGLYSRNGTGTATVDGQTYSLDNTTNTNIYAGTTSDLVITDGPCTIPLNFDGSGGATLVPGYTCTEQSGGETIVWDYRSGSLIQQNAMATVTLSGNVTVAAQGQSYPGTFTETWNLTRLSK